MTSKRTMTMTMAMTAAFGFLALWLGAACGSTKTGDADARTAEAGAQKASLVARVAGPDPGPFGTNLEGAAFDKPGHLYFVDTTAPAGKPKLMSFDLADRSVEGLYTDATSMLNCIGFAPDGTMYLCDLKGGRVVRYDPSTRQLSDVLTEVDGTPIVPDDLAIDGHGDLFVADYQGTPTSPTGRILLARPGGPAQVEIGGLAHPNGIALAPDQTSVWVDEDLAGRLDHIGQQLSSPAATTPAVTVHTAAYFNLGAAAYADSITTDGRGDLYVAVYGAAEVLEFNPLGVQVGTVSVPDSAPHVTHVAIRPGTTDAYVTASGPGGGYIYRFRALAAAPADQPNGG